MCKKCNTIYEDFCKFDKTGKYKGVKCPECNSKSKERRMSEISFQFSNPRGTSKEDSFSYKAGYNMEQAKAQRREAEEKSHMGTDGGYNAIDDITSGKFEGEVK